MGQIARYGIVFFGVGIAAAHLSHYLSLWTAILTPTCIVLATYFAARYQVIISILSGKQGGKNFSSSCGVAGFVAFVAVAAIVLHSFGSSGAIGPLISDCALIVAAAYCAGKAGCLSKGCCDGKHISLGSLSVRPAQIQIAGAALIIAVALILAYKSASPFAVLAFTCGSFGILRIIERILRFDSGALFVLKPDALPLALVGATTFLAVVK